MSLSPRAEYVRALNAVLPDRLFRPAISRLWWLPAHLTAIIGATWAITQTPSVPLRLIAALIIGTAFGGLAFLAHEVLHGAVVRGRRARAVIGAVGFSPFLLSPRLWMKWHGAAHHGHAQAAHADPDVYPTLEIYRGNRVVRFMVDHFSPGGRRITGVFALAVGFSVQSAKLLVTGPRQGIMSRRDRLVAIAGTVGVMAMWATIAALVGPGAFFFSYVIPLLIGNSLVMAHILTNHSLSPQTEVNDPLVNSLTVTVPRWFRWLTLGFGFHVEHHLFPAMSTRHAPLVRAELLRRWPARYRSMPLGRALLTLHRTARVYEDATTLCDPRTRQRWRLSGDEPQMLAPATLAERIPATPSHAAPSASPATLQPLERSCTIRSLDPIAQVDRAAVS